MNLPRIRTDRGSILVYSLLTMSSMLAIGLTLNALFISKFRLAAASRNATVALYAADSAVEMCLYEARLATDDNPGGNPPLALGNDSIIEIINAAPPNDPVTDDCSVLGGAAFGFRAIGTYRGTSRALEISQ